MSADPRQTASATGDLVAGVRAAIDRLVPRGSSVVVAVSGGADSAALLLLWSSLANERRDRLIVAHFDHQLRPGSADDAAHVENLASHLALPFVRGKPASPIAGRAGMGIEEAARHERYAFLQVVARDHLAPFVATAHTSDDQVETILASVLRGSGIHGLAGMPQIRLLAEGVTLVRPLLDVRRADLASYLADLRVEPRNDPTNQDTAWTRARIRARLLPLLREEFQPRVDDALLRLGQIARSVSLVLTSQAENLLARSLVSLDAHHALLDTTALASADRVIVAETFRHLLASLGWPRGEIGFVELERLAELALGAGPRAWDLPGGCHAERVSGDRVLLQRPESTNATDEIPRPIRP